MGWTCYNIAACEEKAEIEKLVNWETEHRAMVPLMTIRKGSVWYVAVKATVKGDSEKPKDYDVDAQGNYVFAVVILTSRNGSEWCYKDMDEAMGPVEAKAPKKLLDMLSRTKGEYALSWRNRCLKNVALTGRKIEENDKIELTKPIEFSDGISRTKFTVKKARFGRSSRKTTYFQCAKTGIDCRINNFMQLEWSKA